MPSCLEVCAGAGGMALGLEAAGWQHDILLEWGMNACRTLSRNNPDWPVVRGDLRHAPVVDITPDLVCGGPPCQPFSLAGNRNGPDDHRDMLLPAMRYAVRLKPSLILFENVPGLMTEPHRGYRLSVTKTAVDAGYAVKWIRFNCADWGVPQNRWRIAVVCLRGWPALREWPDLPGAIPRPSLAEALRSSGMPEDSIPKQLVSGPPGNRGMILPGPVSPTLMGGGTSSPVSHGINGSSPENGVKSRARWNALGLDSRSIRDESVKPESGLVRLTMRNVAALQGFPPGYTFVGTKRHQYSQIGNALPPPAAEQLGLWATHLVSLV